MAKLQHENKHYQDDEQLQFDMDLNAADDGSCSDLEHEETCVEKPNLRQTDTFNLLSQALPKIQALQPQPLVTTVLDKEPVSDALKENARTTNTPSPGPKVVIGFRVPTKSQSPIVPSHTSSSASRSPFSLLNKTLSVNLLNQSPEANLEAVTVNNVRSKNGTDYKLCVMENFFKKPEALRSDSKNNSKSQASSSEKAVGSIEKELSQLNIPTHSPRF
jgi:hypothetical protein